MDILQLRYFYESAKTENFSKTAEKFTVPTTSVSASIKRLERELGCELFDRTSNQVRLNENGRRLQRTLCLVFREMESVMNELSPDHETTREINVLVRGMRRKITELITEYNAGHPYVVFKTVMDHRDDHYQNYDIIIDDKKERYDGYERIELFHMQLCLQCSAKNPLIGQKITLNQLCDQPFVSMDTESNMHKILTKACARVGFAPKVAVICNDIECYEKFIGAGMGIGIARKSDRPDDKAMDIQELNVTDFHEQYTVFAYYSKDEYYGEVKNFVDFLRENV